MSNLAYHFEIWGKWILIWTIILVGVWFEMVAKQQVTVNYGGALGLGCNFTQIPEFDPDKLEISWMRDKGKSEYLPGQSELKKKTRNKRQAEELIYLPRRTQEENLMVGSIKGFANFPNVTQITACLPIPRAVGEFVPWGILTINLTNLEHRNVTAHCEPRPVVGWQEQVTIN